MFEASPSCKKCPSAEQASVCLLDNNERLKGQNIGSANQIRPSKGASFQTSPVFLAGDLDDQSITEAKTVHPKTKFLLPLLIVHFLSHTPGIGNSGPSFSDFSISKAGVLAQKSGLKLT